MIDNRIKEIFNFKKELNVKIVKENFENIKYMNFDNKIYRRFKLIKRIIISINITTFKIILHEIFHRSIFVTNIFIRINLKSKNKYLDVVEFHDIKDKKIYKN